MIRAISTPSVESRQDGPLMNKLPNVRRRWIIIVVTDLLTLVVVLYPFLVPRPVMLPLWLLLPLVDGVSQNVSDYCKETHARAARNGPTSSWLYEVRRSATAPGRRRFTRAALVRTRGNVKSSPRTRHSSNNSRARGFGTTRLLATTCACSRGQNYTEDLRL